METRDELRFNIDAVDVLIRAGMVNISMYDMQLAMSMNNGANYVSMAYVKQFLQNYLIDNRSNSPITEHHLQATIDALNSIVLSGRPIPDGYIILINIYYIVRLPLTICPLLKIFLKKQFSIHYYIRILKY